MTLKIPPPPTLSKDFQQLNRWLLEITSLLNSQGFINTGSVDGLPALTTTVGGLSTTVGGLSTTVAGLSPAVATNTTDITALTASITALTATVAANTTAITALQARNQILNGAGVPAVGLGNNGDLYSNTTGGAGTNLYSKRGGAWVAIA